MSTSKAPIAFPGRVGVWWSSDTWPIQASMSVVRDIEALGYGSVFFGEVANKEALTQASAFLSATRRLVVGTGIANIYARVPSAAETAGRTLTALHPERFVLGLGVSHEPFVRSTFGVDYRNPVSTMRDYLQKMDSVDTAIEPNGGRAPRLIAALGPAMTELSASHADGAHPYLVTPEHTRAARALLGDDRWLIPEQGVTIGGSLEDQLDRAHLNLHVYTGLPNYRKSFLRQGFSEADLIPGGSDRFARSLVGMGSLDDSAAAVQAHLDAGADHVLVQILADNPREDPRPALKELASALGLNSGGD